MFQRRTLTGLLLASLLASGLALAQDPATESPDAPPTTEGVEATPASGAMAVETPADQPAAAAASPAPADLKTTDEAYEVKIRDIEEKVNDLKAKIFQSKARLLQLQESVFTGVTSGARAVLVHRNEMGPSFKLRQIHYFLDQAPLRQEVDETGDSLAEKEKIELFTGSIVPGNHVLSVNLVFQGHGYGVFSYLKGYTFKVTSSHTFKAEEGKETVVEVVAFEKGGFTAELKDRPAVRYDIEVQKLRRREASDGSSGEAAESAAP